MPEAAEEAKWISGKYPSVLFTGDHATQDRILQQMDSTDLIYFATHGLAHETNPLEESYILLSDISAIEQSYCLQLHPQAGQSGLLK